MAQPKALGGITILLCVMVSSASAQPEARQGFDPKAAFCDRQTFLLESIDEVLPWIDYLGGLREARTEAPELDCPSATVRAIYDVFASPHEEAALAKREAFLMGYVAQAMEPASRPRALDQDGSFRYRNDMTLASFGWLLCPGTDEAQMGCMRSLVESLPAEYLETSPVFCDFTTGSKTGVEWPRVMEDPPLTCSPRSSDPGTSADVWLNEFHLSATGEP